MLSFSNLSASVASESLTLFESLSITIPRGKLTALTGPNGSGKSTLLRLIRKRCEEEGLPCALLEQGNANMDSDTWRSPGLDRSARLFALLRELPFDGLLLLDEPTNHLDQPSFTSFLNALRRDRPRLVLMVTHDRRLLRRVDRILHLEEGNLREYGGGYDLYRAAREEESAARRRGSEIARRRENQAERAARQSGERQAKRIRRAEARNRGQKEPRSLINAQRDRASRTAAQLTAVHKRRLDSAHRQAEREKANIPPDGRRFAPPNAPHASKRRGNIARFDNVNFEIPSGPLWTNDISFIVPANARLAVTGANGSGKTTLLEALMGLRQPAWGEIRLFARNPVLLKQIRGEITDGSLLEICAARPGTAADTGGLRTALARAGFSTEQIRRPAKSLSGGEWIRVELMLAFLRKPDLLLLDEPTNDLDARSREMLAQTLRETKLPLVCVSHDGEFLEEAGFSETMHLE